MLLIFDSVYFVTVKLAQGFIDTMGKVGAVFTKGLPIKFNRSSKFFGSFPHNVFK